ncbi:DUF1653 domain-containing protein [Spongiibacter sp. KMU-166]|uniref:DUF1653 domain-containing protein n=1 Tax=Spongiibacter thalassae TaxID=2721624 RepID=A0ABX1GDE8_9GAMM|nr:DUF1653 domain-containing protein [Spongiibacter thalassae]NKI17209.1 DUF1653 domain-containing protein [Spongiibacter thalassae]
MKLSKSLATGRYRHYKGGEYRVYGVARHSESDELHVVYRPLYGDAELWLRPLAMFVENVTVDGVITPRFSLIEAESVDL